MLKERVTTQLHAVLNLRRASRSRWDRDIREADRQVRPGDQSDNTGDQSDNTGDQSDNVLSCHLNAEQETKLKKQTKRNS